MADERLRRLERRWLESDSPQDELAYLIARLRAGELTRERLELTAYLGHPATLLVPRPHTPGTQAILAMGHTPTCPVVDPHPPADLPERVQAALTDYLALGGKDWAVRHYVRSALDRSLDIGNPWEWPGVPPVSVCPLCRRVVGIRDWFGRIRRWGRRITRRAVLCVASQAARYNARGLVTLGFRDRSRLRAWVRDEAFARKHALLDEIDWLARGADGSLAQRMIRGGVQEGALREELRDVLVPFALGTGDPVRERVRAWLGA